MVLLQARATLNILGLEGSSFDFIRLDASFMTEAHK